MRNFLEPRFNPQVSCSAVPDDCYSPENLISKHSHKRALGFMAYNVTKPPVDLIFDIICPISVHQIKIWSNIGSLKSTRFEVSVRNGTDSEYRRVGNGTTEQTTGIVFEKYDSVASEHSPEMARSFFHCGYSVRSVLESARSVKVTIQQTARCVPVLRQIQIWGTPSSSASKAQCDEIARLSKTETNPKPALNLSRTTVSAAPTAAQPTFDIPEFCLDPITCEIMCLPMALPSGKTVDQSTLDKHNRFEESWGRMPSDPFTGILFTCDRKPILDAALKSRIDLFLLQNAEQPTLRNVPRTVGSTSSSSSSSGNSNRPTSVGRENTHYSSNHVSKKLKIQLATEANSSSSLDVLVQSALSQITRFSEVSPPTKSCVCHLCTKATEELYQIDECLHFICRNCLLVNRLKELLTCACGKPFRRSEIKKFNKK